MAALHQGFCASKLANGWGATNTPSHSDQARTLEVRVADCPLCKIEGCAKPVVNGRGWCTAHYKRWRRHGDPLAGRTALGAPMKWLRDHAAHEDEVLCLRWPFALTTGRPSIRLGGKTQLACRIMCELARGPSPTTEHHAAHSCGKGHEGCINPRHLSWKTPAENEADKLEHHTSNRGSRHGMSKITETQARAILAAKGKVSQRALAAQFGIDQSTISNIWTGKRWGWL